jgi:hypothetical protein
MLPFVSITSSSQAQFTRPLLIIFNAAILHLVHLPLPSYSSSFPSPTLQPLPKASTLRRCVGNSPLLPPKLLLLTLFQAGVERKKMVWEGG